MDPLDVAPDRWVAARDRSRRLAEAWRMSADRLALADMFDAVAAASLPVARDRARELLADDGWARRLLAPLLAGLADDPLFEPPLRVHREGGRIGAVLFDGPAARITASVTAAAAVRALPDRVVLSGHVHVARYVRGGDAILRRWRRADDRLEPVEPVPIPDGAVIVHDGRREAHAVTGASSDLVMLNVILRAGTAPVSREFRLPDGAVARTASTDDAASRAAMLLTLLRVSGRKDAGPAFDAATRDPAPHARWSAMREWLALDAGTALPRLAAMADGDPDADVRGVARATVEMVARKAARCPG